MFIRISNTPRDYPWGSTTAIAELFGRPPSGRPEAELWLGSHPGSPSVVEDPTHAHGAVTLADRGELPFLLKVLAAQAPLSLQAHPTPAQAIEGFERENAANIPLDAPHRNYKDASAKPELIVAIDDGFEALCGFREVAAARDVFAEVAHGSEGPAFEPLFQRLDGADPIRETFEWLVSHERGELAVLDNLCTAAARAEGTEHDRDEYAVVRRLAEHYPGDAGIAVSVLLNHVRLRAGEALYLPAGNIHAYLVGLGIELMVSSDNVLRGGLTSKHVDVAELLAVLDFRSMPVPRLVPDTPVEGVRVYRPHGVGLALAMLSTGTLTPEGEAIALCLSGETTLIGTSSVRLARGEAALVTVEERPLTVRGDGDVVIAATGFAR